MNILLTLLIAISNYVVTPLETFYPEKIIWGTDSYTGAYVFEVYPEKLVLRNEETLFKKTFPVTSTEKRSKNNTVYYAGRYAIVIFRHNGDIYRVDIQKPAWHIILLESAST